MFSQADYALAARLMGLPMPVTPAEQAAAVPVTSRVLRDFMQMRPPSPNGDADGMYTGATRSLNTYPDVEYPETKAKIASRLRTEVAEPSSDLYLTEMLMEICKSPEAVMALLQLLDQLDSQQQDQMNELSSQRPAEFDMPNEGANYSMLNAPGSNSIPPSMQYQQLS